MRNSDSCLVLADEMASLVPKAIKPCQREFGTAPEILSSFKQLGRFGPEPESESDSHCTPSVLLGQSAPSPGPQGCYLPLPSFVAWPAFLEAPDSLATQSSGTEASHSIGDEAILLLGSENHGLSQNSNSRVHQLRNTLLL
jgi:hypothetical protein